MKKDDKKIIYFYSLTTNFKPENTNNFNNLGLFNKTQKDKVDKNNNKIICRNFFLFFVLMKYNKKNSFSNSSFFIKPLKKNVQTILRAPYRHKITRHQLTLIRYNIIFKLVFNSKKIIKLSNFDSIKKVMKTLSLYNSWVESNIISNYKVRYRFNFYYLNNFIIKNFVKNKKKCQWLCSINTISTNFVF